MGLTAKRERKKLEIRDKIIDAARQLIAMAGYKNVTMRKIAALIEYSPTVIYAHFNDKQSLLNALADEEYLELSEKTCRHVAEQDPVKRLRLIGQEIVDFAIKCPNQYRASTITPRLSKNRLTLATGKKNDVQQDMHTLIMKSVWDAIQQGQFKKDFKDVELVSQTFYASIHGIITMYLENDMNGRINWRPIQQRINFMIDLIMHGLMNDPMKSIDNRMTAVI